MILAALLFQTSSVPIWVPLAIILLIILLFWWGLTRNRILEENEPATDHEAETSELDTIDEPLESAEEEKTEPSEEPAPVIEEADRSPGEIEEVESLPEPDDLKTIEGIGPKISGILADAGITTFAQLAGTDPAQLEQIVRHDAGIKVANPTSWPQQAALAASGDWDGLEELQNRLIAGRHRD